MLFIYFLFISNQLSEMIKEAVCYPGKVGIISMFVDDVWLRLTDVGVFTLWDPNGPTDPSWAGRGSSQESVWKRWPSSPANIESLLAFWCPFCPYCWSNSSSKAALWRAPQQKWDSPSRGPEGNSNLSSATNSNPHTACWSLLLNLGRRHRLQTAGRNTGDGWIFHHTRRNVWNVAEY